MVDWNKMFWGNPNGYSGIPTLYEQRRQLGQRMGMPSQGTRERGMAVERADRPSPYVSTDDRIYNVYGVPDGTPMNPQPQPAAQPPALSGAMADARAQEIAYANSTMPQAGSMQAARAQEIAYANSQPNPAARRGVGAVNSGQMYGPDMPKPALYMVDFGDGSPVRSFMSQDGVAPNIPGANVMLDESFNPNAGALTKLIRGVF